MVFSPIHPHQSAHDHRFDVSYLENTGVEFDASAQATDFQGIFFKPDGTKMYLCSRVTDALHEYDLSTAWDVTSASFLQTDVFPPGSHVSNPQGMFFRANGTKMYVYDATNKRIEEYDLSSAWDISSSTHNDHFDVTSELVNCYGISFKPDGTKMFLADAIEDIHEYALSTAWDVTTASLTASKNYTGDLSIPTGMFF